MKLIQSIDVYAPQHLGKKDVLTINDKIVKIKDAGSMSADGFLSDAEEQGQGHDTVSLPFYGCRYCGSAVFVCILPPRHEADGSCIVFDLGMRL